MKNSIVISIIYSLLFFSCIGPFKGNFPETQFPAELEVVTRKAWKWKKIKGDVPIPQEIKKITIHHGGEEFSPEKDPVQYLLNLQNWSRNEKKWVDIPYHFMIDLQGKIYEARPLAYPGDTNTSYDPTGHALICVMGNYEVQTLSEVQLQAVVDLTAYLAQSYNLTIRDIGGHKDYTETLCPGKDLYRYLEDGTIPYEVNRLLKKQE
ncbi:MAG: N-acetylmuramoyl-L-alanine amidase [Calditrichaeota bacterium]|nr:MAG: N-acetylmuramoyl-L-alanine amidase [Calditrichota bacterium]